MQREINWYKVAIIIVLVMAGGIILPIVLVTLIWMALTNARWSETLVGDLFDVWE